MDVEVGGGIGGDNSAPRAPGGGGALWTADGKGIIERYAKEGRANLAIFDAATGKMTDITSGNQAILSYRATPDTRRFVYVASTPTKVTDLYVLDRGGQPKQITRVNDALFSKLNLT